MFSDVSDEAGSWFKNSLFIIIDHPISNLPDSNIRLKVHPSILQLHLLPNRPNLLTNKFNWIVKSAILKQHIRISSKKINITCRLTRLEQHDENSAPVGDDGCLKRFVVAWNAVFGVRGQPHREGCEEDVEGGVGRIFVTQLLVHADVIPA